MRHFTHPKNPRVVLRRVCPQTYITSDMIGQIYEIVELVKCTGKRGGVEGCIHSGDPNCPGYIRLDRAPFDGEPQCYSWSGKSIFDFM